MNTKAINLTGHQTTTNSPYKTGTWMLLAVVVMTFAGISSLIVVRHASANDWGTLDLPKILYFAVIPLLLAMLANLMGFRRSKDRSRLDGPLSLHLAWASGAIFLGMLLKGWQLIANREISPSLAAFCLLAGAYALFMGGGVVVFFFAVLRRNRMDGKRFAACSEAAVLYWNGLTLLWLYVLLILSIL